MTIRSRIILTKQIKCVSGQDFLPFADLEQSVRDDVAFLRNSPLIPKDIPISGAIYDVRTGRVHEVVRA